MVDGEADELEITERTPSSHRLKQATIPRVTGPAAAPIHRHEWRTKIGRGRVAARRTSRRWKRFRITARTANFPVGYSGNPALRLTGGRHGNRDMRWKCPALRKSANGLPRAQRESPVRQRVTSGCRRSGPRPGEGTSATLPKKSSAPVLSTYGSGTWGRIRAGMGKSTGAGSSPHRTRPDNSKWSRFDVTRHRRFPQAVPWCKGGFADNCCFP